LALAAFHNQRVGSGRLSKPAKTALAGFQKLSAQLREICYSIGAKDLNSPVLKSFLQI
jgi:hypothetical protein